MRCSRVLIASGILGFVGAQAQAVPAPDDSLGPVLFYRQPAKEWVEALPIGNGRLGGMVFGGVPAERIQLNEDTFWSGGPYDPINSEALQYLPTVRQLIRDGRYKEAQDLADEKLMGRPRHLQAYQPLGDLRLVVEGHEHPTDYRRELDLDRAVVRVRYRIGDTTFTREVFSSAPDQSIVIRLTADGPAKLRFLVTLDSKQPFAVRPLPPRGLLMTGRWRGDLTKPEEHLKLSRGLQARWYGEGLGFAVQIAAEAQGGRVEVDEKGLHIVDAESVTLRLAAATSFKGRNPEAACCRCAPCRATVWRAARAARGGLPLALPARPPGSRLDGTRRVAHRRAPRGGARGSRRPGARRDLFPVRPLPAHRQLAAGHPACQPPGPLERRREPRLGEQVHDQHQHRDELLACRGDEPRGVPRAALRPDRGAARARPTDGAGPLRGARLRGPPQHRPLACGDAPSTAPVGVFGRWAPRGSRPTSSSTTPSARIGRSCERPTP